jgi:sRNA-binding regulator protein Hfq
MIGTSTIYTIGTALNRACDAELTVQILVEGQWLSGQVMAVDGHGVVIDSDGQEHSVIRMESVSAVRIASPSPHRVAVPAPRSPSW